MTLGPLIPFLAVAMIASVTGMVHGAGWNDPQFSRLAALGFIIAVCVAGLYFNVNSWRAGHRSTETGPTIRRNARLAALIYAWGAAAMFAVYSLSELSWQHSWQYGLGMAIIGIGIFIYVFWLGEEKLPPLFLTIFHGLAAAGGLAYLIGFDKLQTIKADWAANEVFLWGGSGIILLCLLSLVTQLLHNKTV